MSTLVDEATEEVADALSHAVQDTPEFVSNLVANAYHRMLEAVFHPHNAEAIEDLRRLAAIASRPKDNMAAQLLSKDAAAVCEFLGVTPADHDAVVASLSKTDPLKERLKESIRPAVERIMNESLEHMPTDGLPN